MPVPDYTSTRYRMDLSRKEVHSYLRAVKECVRRGAFMVLKGDPDDRADSRQKNVLFMRTYGLWHHDTQRALLLGITEDEFCHVVVCNDGRELYVFCLDRTLCKVASGFERVRLYVKHDLSKKGSPYDIVVSLHPLELPILKVFES